MNDYIFLDYKNHYKNIEIEGTGTLSVALSALYFKIKERNLKKKL